LDDKAQTLSYEHYYPYGGTAIITGKDKTQVQQKRYRYTNLDIVLIPCPVGSVYLSGLLFNQMIFYPLKT
jgi:hypothetical protein